MPATLVIPLVSTGNVPQLTVDLILHSLSSEFDFVKSLDSTYLHPFVGPLDYVFDQSEPVLFSESSPQKVYSTALELFYNKARRLYVLQQRTPIIQGYSNNFVKEVISPLIAEYQVDEVVILDSFGALDEDVVAASIPCRTNNDYFSDGICEVRSIGDMIREFEQSMHLNSESSLRAASSLFTFTPESVQQEISIKQQVFKFVYHLLNSPLVSLKHIKYCSAFVHEGDNSEDAHLLCDHLPLIIQTFDKIKKHTPPVSWKGVYGSRPIPSSFEEGLYI